MTEEKEVYSSIFDAASRIEKKKSQKPTAAAPAEKEAEPVKKPPPLTDEEIKVQFEECTRLHNLLADRIELMLGVKKLTIRALREYFSTSRNFTANEWSLIQKQKNIIQSMLNKLVPFIQESGPKPAKGKSQEKAPKKMQVKSRWISMR
jgi:hypothetical protein